MYCVTVQLVVIVHGDGNYLYSFKEVFIVVHGSRCLRVLSLVFSPHSLGSGSVGGKTA